MAEIIRFSTDELPPGRRAAYFVAATTDFVIEPAEAPETFSASAMTMQLAPLMITRFDLSPSRCFRDLARIGQDGRDHFSINFLLSGEAEAIMDGTSVPYAAGDALVVDLLRSMTVTTRVHTSTINVLVTRQYLESVLPALTMHRSIPSGGAVTLAREHASRLLQHPPADDAGVASLHARALRDTLAAMLTPFHRDDPLERRRSASLLARAGRYIDANLGAELDVAGVCTALGVSRSVLYRALGPVGGIETLILRRRLARVHRLLTDPSDTRPIAGLARGCGFTNMSQFNRQFRRVFGDTPGRVRAGQHPADSPMLMAADDWSARYQALVHSVTHA